MARLPDIVLDDRQFQDLVNEARVRVARRCPEWTDHNVSDPGITLILATAPGERPMRPNFGCGIHDYIFESVDAHVVGRLEREIRIAIDRWEPRIELRQITIDTSSASNGQLPIELEYVVRATNDRRNLVYPFYVIPAEE